MTGIVTVTVTGSKRRDSLFSFSTQSQPTSRSPVSNHLGVHVVWNTRPQVNTRRVVLRDDASKHKRAAGGVAEAVGRESSVADQKLICHWTLVDRSESLNLGTNPEHLSTLNTLPLAHEHFFETHRGFTITEKVGYMFSHLIS